MASLQTDALLRFTSAEGVCRLCDRPGGTGLPCCLGIQVRPQVEPLGGVGRPLGTAPNTCSSSWKSGRPFCDAQYRTGMLQPQGPS